jgi:hypothetical protein
VGSEPLSAGSVCSIFDKQSSHTEQPMNDFEIMKRELLQPLLLEAGAALLNCQYFEDGIGVLLHHLASTGVKGINPEKIALILDGHDKKTAGQLIGMLKRYVELDDSAERVLADALAARNRLIHRVLIESVEHLRTNEGQSAVVGEIRSLRLLVLKAHEMLRPTILALGQMLTGVVPETFMQEVKAPVIVEMIRRVCDQWDAKQIKAFDLGRRVAGLARELESVRPGTDQEGRSWERQLNDAWSEMLSGEPDQAVKLVSEVVARIRAWTNSLGIS